MKIPNEKLVVLERFGDSDMQTVAGELIAARALIECARNWDAFDRMAEDEECYEIIEAYRNV